MALVHSVPYDAEKYRFAQQQKAQRKAQSDAAVSLLSHTILIILICIQAALAKTTALPPWEDKTTLLKGEDETVPSRHSSPDTRAHAHDQQNQVRSRRSVSYTPPDNAASILSLKSEEEEEEEANAKEKAGKRIPVGSALSFSPNDLIFTQY